MISVTLHIPEWTKMLRHQEMEHLMHKFQLEKDAWFRDHRKELDQLAKDCAQIRDELEALRTRQAVFGKELRDGRQSRARDEKRRRIGMNQIMERMTKKGRRRRRHVHNDKSNARGQRLKVEAGSKKMVAEWTHESSLQSEHQMIECHGQLLSDKQARLEQRIQRFNAQKPMLVSQVPSLAQDSSPDNDDNPDSKANSMEDMEKLFDNAMDEVSIEEDFAELYGNLVDPVGLEKCFNQIFSEEIESRVPSLQNDPGTGVVLTMTDPLNSDLDIPSADGDAAAAPAQQKYENSDDEEPWIPLKERKKQYLKLCQKTCL